MSQAPRGESTGPIGQSPGEDPGGRRTDLDEGPTRWRHRLEYAGLRSVLWLLSPFSEGMARRLGRTLGQLAFTVFRIRRRVTLDNLREAFPEWTEARRLEVARACYLHFGVTFLELVRFPRHDREWLRQEIYFEEEENFRQALGRGRGAVLFTGHFGNWEAMGGALAARGYPISVLVASQKNPKVDRYVTGARASTGMNVLKVDAGLRAAIRRLRRNEFVAVVGDQDAGRGGVFIPFLGRLASTAVGAARLARMARCPIIAGFSVREADGRYRVEMPGPIEVPAGGDPRAAEREATERTMALLEERIRRYPEQWFWMHRRWKTRPPAEAEEEGRA